MRLRLAPLVVAVALVAGVPATAASSPSTDCQRYHAESVPAVHPDVDVGHVELCDEDNDEVVDTVRFDTEHVHSDGVVSVTSEEKQRSDHRDDETQAKARVSPSGPADPVVYHQVEVRDDDDDGQVDEVSSQGGLFTDLEDTFYFLSVKDIDDDGEFDSFGLLTCSPNGCQAPDADDIPRIPERIDLPDLVFRVEPVGYVP